jgi:hypothetical protein
MEGECVNKMEYSGLMRMIQIIFWIALGIVVVGGVFLILPRFIFPFFASISPKIPEPEITYGEFPFRNEYELDGQIHVIEDVVIAEFDGFEFSTGSMKRERTWRTSLASGRIELPFEGENDIYFSRGNARYYMGEIVQALIFKPHILISGEIGVSSSVELELEEAQDILAEYGITLISWEISEPIINNFGD